MDERRTDIRTAFHAYVRLTHPRAGAVELALRDMSDGGVFLLTRDHDSYAIGDLVEIQATEIEDAPVVPARVVRHEPHGIGLKFVED